MLEYIVEAILKGHTDLDVIAKIVGISSERLAYMLNAIDGITINEGKIQIKNKIALILTAIERGASPYTLSRFLTWKEFEDETSRILYENGYIVYSNVIFYVKTRRQIDIVAVSLNKVLIIDCKHWKRSSPSQLRDLAKIHNDKISSFIKTVKLASLAKKGGFKKGIIIPIIVTLSSSFRGHIEGTFIVPIKYLDSFLKDIDRLIEELPSKIFYSV